MIHPIVLYNNLTLRNSSHPIDLETADGAEVREMIDDMFETMHRAKGIGLSAIQIGVPVRAFVIEAHLTEGPEEDQFDIRETFINPTIMESSNETIYLTEGCLSIPKVAALVERPKSITVKYFNYKLEEVTEEFSGFKSRIIQHEFDHLNGVLFIDNLENMWKMMLEDQLSQIADGTNKPAYLHK